MCRYEYTAKNASPEELLELAKTSDDLCVLREIAEHPKTPIEALRILLRDDLYSRARHPDEWDRSIVYDIHLYLTWRKPIEPELVRMLMDDAVKNGDSRTPESLVDNDSTPEEILEEIQDQFGGVWQVRDALNQRWDREHPEA